MPSPFPGMDPYLESRTLFADFHATFIPMLREVILDALPHNYVARIHEEVLLLEPENPPHRLVKPDVTITRDPFRTSGHPAANTATIEAEPVTLQNVQPLDPHIELHIEIVRLPEEEVVTVVEVLSPKNKAGSGRSFYLEKRQRLLRRPVSIVELDLLRSGKRPELSAPPPAAHYYALISPSDHRPDCRVYPRSVRQRLPVLPIPLKNPDPDVHVDIQHAFALAYDRGRYHRLIDYTRPPPPPPFEREDADWVLQTARAGQPT